MAARSVWKGFLQINLVSIPVKAYTATSSGGEVKLNQLHAGGCNARIQYKKFCPVHGEVSQDQIVSGFEHAKGQYVIIDTSEIQKLRSEDDKAIKVNTFIAPNALDPIYFSGKTHYLVPDGPVGQKAYSVFMEAMAHEESYGLAQIVLHGKEQLVLLRPVGDLLGMMTLQLDAEVTKPAAFSEEAPKAAYAPEELKLMETLIESSTVEKLDYAQYKDVYTERLTKLIEAKVAGEELVAPPAHEHAQIINLMDALKQSVEEAQKKEAARTGAVAPKKPAKKIAPTTPPGEAASKRKRKLS